MLLKVVFDVFGHRVAKPEIVRLSPVVNHRFAGFQPNAMKFPKNLRRLALFLTMLIVIMGATVRESCNLAALPVSSCIQ